MKTYKIESMEIKANNKKEAVNNYIAQHFETFMVKCEKSFSALYAIAKAL